MKVIEKSLIKGHLIIRVIDGKSGKELWRVDKPNLIVNGTKAVLTRLLDYTNPEQNQVWTIGAGDSNTSPSVTDTDLLGTKTVKKKYDSRTIDESAGYIELEMTLAPGEGNVLLTGEYFEEAGLFSRGDNDDPDLTSGETMMARQLHAPIHKDNSISLEYTWRLQVAIS